MIRFKSANIESLSLFWHTKDHIKLFEEGNFKKVWNLYIRYCKALGRIVGDVSFKDEIGAINVMGIKRDPEVSFNLPGTFYNDILVVAKNTESGQDFYIYKVTMDPKAKKNKIAHLLLGMYASYKVRPHRWISTRTAICQDRDAVLLARTDKEGNIINATPYKGFFGINLHDSDRYINTSLGCTVLERDSNENGNHYKQSYKPLLKSITNKDDIVYAVTSLNVISKLVYALSLGDNLTPLPMDKSLFKVFIDRKASFIQKYFLKG